ncbi:Hypothetical predicted protein [Olea europaea subsp. europaea]|uniref:ATP-citrate synthase citrate-binding domain-containing protein n=1 Tax=Olea europaea subsp. europaea TaxID=158383 RepID=A0A8S0RUZ9_OLEEU|nr:Hypothetical predicted protein [Olea europaea subsp. europaea]
MGAANANVNSAVEEKKEDLWMGCDDELFTVSGTLAMATTKVSRAISLREVGDLGYASKLGNFAEYNGAPNEEEVLQYAKVVIDESKLKAARMHSYVGRGGPNYQKGLAKMRPIAEEIGIPIEVYGPEATMTGICKQAIECITAAA